MPRVADPNLLVGFETADDAGVYRITPDLALVQTVDFFTPIVDDPFTFGAIAAANSLSDVYAMGGTPLTALSILAWPGGNDVDDLQQILLGGAEKMREASCVIVGGHSVSDPEIKFGYAVTGKVHPDRVLKNAGAHTGDVLMLTKRLGTGVISTALKQGIASEAHVAASIRSMLTLNREAGLALSGAGGASSGSSNATRRLHVNAATDVTGFGLLGHAREMALASDVTLEIEAAHVPLLDGALEYARKGAIPGGLKNNREFVESCVEGASDVDDLLYDPQTSGGLLVALPEDDARQFAERYPEAMRIGRVLERGAKPIRIV